MVVNVRNFCIIAHINHGKTTLVNAFLKENKEIKYNIKENLLDKMYLEKKKGITIKSKTIQIKYIYNKKQYLLNLIDTPGHIDFCNEVLKSIYSCEGAILLIDGGKSIQCQTINNYLLAKKNNLFIIPVINKIDLNCNIKIVENDILKLLKCQKKSIHYISAKNNIGIKKLIIDIIKNIPFPNGNNKKKLEILILNFKYNNYKKIKVYCKIINGQVYKGKYINFFKKKKKYKVEEVGYIKYNKKIKKKKLVAGQVGYLIINLKFNYINKINNIIVEDNNIKLSKILKKVKNIKPIVYVNIFSKKKENKKLECSLKKLKLNDNSFFYKKYNFKYLGLGFKCGFLGMLHMDIIIKRLENEYNLSVYVTTPSVKYLIKLKNKKKIYIDSYDDLPNKNIIEKTYEPYVIINIITICKFIGRIINFCYKKRGKLNIQKNLFGNQINIKFIIPLYEIIFDFFNILKSITHGYCDIYYYFYKYKITNLVKLNLLINNKNINNLSFIINKENSIILAKYLCNKLVLFINRGNFLKKINVKINNKIILKNIIKPFRKNVINKCYGGDITRKKKLLNKQKIGIKRNKKYINLKIYKNIFLKILNINN
ncbi:MAG: translation elongation factor 4 [Candidatus Shikimatogenerans sp. Ttur]|uniref:Tetracycline resistance protein TetQ n=1 Tax=Candidatus Shikimatogenerans sp. Ttur TaxID=3158569 RepID=A0AAU7ZYV3_9FLAO